MNYVVFDLEWNQPLSHKQYAYRRVGSRLMFELIQIGAAKLDENRRLRGSFNRYIAPAHYTKLHPRIRRITGIQQEDLAGAHGFSECMHQFLDWCGPDCALLTWGCDDISVLRQNMDFFGVTDALPAVYDLQKLYVDSYPEDKRRSLAAAVQRLDIALSCEQSFHNAADDAYLSARVFQRLENHQAVLACALQARELGRDKSAARREKCEELSPASPLDYLRGAGLRWRCPVCARTLTSLEGYVPLRGAAWMALADCPVHGLVQAEVEPAPSAEDPGRLRRRICLGEEQNPAYVRTKHLQWAQKAAAWQQGG